MSFPKQLIHIVDDDYDTLDFLSYNLQKDGYIVHTSSTGNEAIELANSIIPDLIILDVMMPGMDGIETCRKLRSIPGLNHTIIAFLTARGEDYSLVAGLDVGADDYILKPIKPHVLLSRVKALLRRNKDNQQEDIQLFGSLSIDRERYLVIKNEKEFSLPRKEFELLSYLSSKPGKVFTRDEILKIIWGEEVIVGERTIDVHIRKLREKIGNEYIKTIKGIGYKFEF
ncbi:MAG: response regulator transcription factor [Bacteroidetes bacterium]|nr:response regulator transcription factor [Bacteroidota bacterium]MBL6962674.1 response regulator transcription factor [Bacteroidota bacterium]